MTRDEKRMYYIQQEVNRIFNIDWLKPKLDRWDWARRLPKGLKVFKSRNKDYRPYKRYTAKSKGRTGAAIRFHVIQRSK